jgi:hypothetical protein
MPTINNLESKFSSLVGRIFWNALRSQGAVHFTHLTFFLINSNNLFYHKYSFFQRCAATALSTRNCLILLESHSRETEPQLK